MKKIKQGSLSRGLSLAKLSLKTGAKAAGNYLSGHSADNEDYITSQMKLIAGELGELKGTMMKIGQGLSMYGEHFLPPKANEFLKSLQYQSPPLDWEAIETTIEKELGLSVFNELEIEEKALASASLGQVHKATHKKTGEIFAMKVQYPGVDEAIASDMKNLSRVFSLAKIFPSEMKLDLIFSEIQTMLHQETDYKIEHSWTHKVFQQLKGKTDYIVPQVQDKYCTSKILTTSFLSGENIDAEAIKNLSQEERNHIGFLFLDYYLDELFLYKSVQTDPHFGNYRIKLNENKKHQLVLFDFGAVRAVPEHFAEGFKSLILAAVENKPQQIVKSGIDLGYLKEEDSDRLKQSYIDLCLLIVEPFDTARAPSEFLNEEGGYMWKKTDLPSRAAKAGAEIAKNFKLRTPPKEAVFLDRKLGGTFIFLSALDFQANTKDWLLKKLKEQS